MQLNTRSIHSHAQLAISSVSFAKAFGCQVGSLGTKVRMPLSSSRCKNCCKIASGMQWSRWRSKWKA
eukprot:2510253-Amphidinium_carterae.1